MTWLRIDDKMPRNPKVAPLTDAAFRLHMHALAHCAEHETDGFVADDALEGLSTHRNKAKLVGELETKRPKRSGEPGEPLWHRVDGGWSIKDFTEFNPSHADLEAKRKAAKERIALARSRSVRANISGTSEYVRSTPARGLGWDQGSPDPEGSAEGNPRPESAYDLARRVWAEEWHRVKRAGYTFSPNLGPKGEHETIRAIGQWATEQGGEDAERFARHLVSMYLRDKDPYVSNPNHPIKLLGARLNQYGEPPRKRPPESATRVKVDEPALPPGEALERARKALAEMAKVGT